MTKPPATLAQLRDLLTEAVEQRDEDMVELTEALGLVLKKLDELLELVTTRTAPP